MSITILRKTFPEPPLDEQKIWRYAACNMPTDDMVVLLHACLDELQHNLTYAVCYAALLVHVDGTWCDLGAFPVSSASLATLLSGCDTAVVFAATVGVEIDRRIARYGQLAPTKALLFQAIGTERIESLCDAFCATLNGAYGKIPTARFSPGYGDLPLALQRDVFALLDCPKHIGVTLCDSLLMSPSKSVTAIVGLRKDDVL